MYADKMTPSMSKAIDETNRRRAKQIAYNLEQGVDPQPLRKRIADITDQLAREDADTEKLLGGSGRRQSRGKAPVPGRPRGPGRQPRRRCPRRRGRAGDGGAAREDLIALITTLTDQMHAAAAELQFELAARFRDEVTRAEAGAARHAGRRRLTNSPVPSGERTEPSGRADRPSGMRTAYRRPARGTGPAEAEEDRGHGRRGRGFNRHRRGRRCRMRQGQRQRYSVGLGQRSSSVRSARPSQVRSG